MWCASNGAVPRPIRSSSTLSGDGGEIEAKRLFYGDASSVGEARHFVRDTLAATDAPPDVVDAAVLLVSELATKVTLHARTDLQVIVRFVDGVLWGEVRDWNACLPQASLAPTDATTGRGLTLVDAVATRWGVESEGNSKMVWFTVEPKPPSAG